jgi:hypothetical protein
MQMCLMALQYPFIHQSIKGSLKMGHTLVRSQESPDGDTGLVDTACNTGSIYAMSSDRARVQDSEVGKWVRPIKWA